MGKNKHSKDRMFLTATEWKMDYGGKKQAKVIQGHILPFDHCALSLTPFVNPCCTPEVRRDYHNIIYHIPFSLFISIFLYASSGCYV